MNWNFHLPSLIPGATFDALLVARNGERGGARGLDRHDRKGGRCDMYSSEPYVELLIFLLNI
jgi:hypothetical protein